MPLRVIDSFSQRIDRMNRRFGIPEVDFRERYHRLIQSFFSPKVLHTGQPAIKILKSAIETSRPAIMTPQSAIKNSQPATKGPQLSSQYDKVWDTVVPDKTWLECEGAEGANILLLGADLERIREGIKPYNIILAIVDYNGDLQYEKQYQQFLKNLTPASSHPGAYKFEHGSLWLSKDGEESLVGCKDSSLFFSQSADGPKISYCYYRDPKKEIRTTKNVWGLGGKVMQCSALNPAAVLSLEIPVLAPRGVTQQLPRTRMHDFVLHIPGVLQYLDEKREELDGLWRIRSFHFKDVSTAAKFRQLKY